MTKGTAGLHILANPHNDQRGITGLETAIVLIAFVVVASVFAFTVLNTGLLSSEKSKETVLGGLGEASATIALRDDVIADANPAKASVDTITFTLTPASTSSEPVDLSATGTAVPYLDAARGLKLYGFGIRPRVYGQFLAFLFYRWEVIMRETAILGILGIATLGFFIDSALADIRLDRAMFLIAVTAVFNMGIDILSRRIRSRLMRQLTALRVGLKA